MHNGAFTFFGISRVGQAAATELPTKRPSSNNTAHTVFLLLQVGGVRQSDGTRMLHMNLRRDDNNEDKLVDHPARWISDMSCFVTNHGDHGYRCILNRLIACRARNHKTSKQLLKVDWRHKDEYHMPTRNNRYKVGDKG